MNVLEKMFAEFIDTIEEVPFGNSDFQNRNSIINNELTPGRAYRHAALRICNRFNALREAYYNLEDKKLEVEELKEKEDKRSKLRVERLEGDIRWMEKLIKDAVREIESLAPVITKRLTRKEFEDGESEHFQKRLNTTYTDQDLYSKMTNGNHVLADLSRILRIGN